MENFKQIWAEDVDKSLQELSSSHTGLAETEAKDRLAKYGNNVFKGKEKQNAISLFMKQFLSPLIFLLIGAGTLSAVLGEWIDTIVIIFAVLINVALGFYHEYGAENTLEKLTTYIKDRARVIRDGKEEEIDSGLIVPGDIVKLSYGTRIPADARIINTNNFRVDEAILTGESIPILKSEETLSLGLEVADRKNIAHAGTLVVEGYATGVVYATGNNTEIGKIAGIVSSIDRVKTPLQKGVDKMAWLIFFVVIFIVVGIFVLGISRGEPVLPMLLLSSAVAVGAVPEALPIVLTVILAIGATHIANKKGIIRKLNATETLGSTTLIMTDKTGTLTMADMKLVGIFGKDEIVSGKADFIQEGENDFNQHQKKLLERSLTNLDLTIENQNEEIEKWVFHGRPFEVNIAKACVMQDVPIDDLLAKSPFLVLPFNSTNKFSVSLKGERYTVMGAPDILLKRSSISKEEYIKIEKFIEETSYAGKRLLGLASFPQEKGNQFDIDDVQDIEFLGMLAFYDPIRPEVPNAIKNIESHGMKIVLITGDLVGTALSVAQSLDWEVKEDQVLTGAEIKGMKDDELLGLIPNIKIFARVTPEDKLRIGQLYQKLGEIVAMTGDGVNDAPALKAMDMGISLGSGSDVAKSAADLVLLDDNFNTISLAIDEARRILANVRKSFVYLMSNSLDEVFVVGGSLIMGLAMPLTALQIIWVNLFTGSLPALAFAYEENDDKEKYRGHDLGLIFSKRVKVLTLGIGVLSSVLLFFLYYFLLKTDLSLEQVRSVFFVCFSSYILAISFSFRSLNKPIFSYNPFSNKKLNYSILIATIILIITMTVPFMRGVFEIAPMPLSWLPFVFLWLAVNILLIEGAKYAMHLSKKYSIKKKH